MALDTDVYSHIGMIRIRNRIFMMRVHDETIQVHPPCELVLDLQYGTVLGSALRSHDSRTSTSYGYHKARKYVAVNRTDYLLSTVICIVPRVNAECPPPRVSWHFRFRRATCDEFPLSFFSVIPNRRGIWTLVVGWTLLVWLRLDVLPTLSTLIL